MSIQTAEKKILEEIGKFSGSVTAPYTVSKEQQGYVKGLQFALETLAQELSLKKQPIIEPTKGVTK